jgi:hypothetical protein
VYIKADALPKKGIIIKVPTIIPNSVKEKWLNESDL